MADSTTERLIAEVQAIVEFVEARTGWRSRWNGDVVVADSVFMLLARTPFLAKKEWNCRIVVLDRIVESDLRWRVLLHEVLHSVSAGSRENDYRAFIGWEEGIVEWLQRLYRPDLLREIGVDAPASVFAAAEQNWTYEPHITALRRLHAALSDVSEQTFLETLLKTPLAQRPAEVMAWGKRETLDVPGFIRIFAQASGILRG